MSADSIWTSEPPQEAGRYWLRYPSKHSTKMREQELDFEAGEHIEPHERRSILPVPTAEAYAALVAERDELRELLRQSKREHEPHRPNRRWRCCPALLPGWDNINRECDCGASEWNARVDEALKEQP